MSVSALGILKKSFLKKKIQEKDNLTLYSYTQF